MGSTIRVDSSSRERVPGGGGREAQTSGSFRVRVGLYTILSLTIVCVIYCNKGGSRGNNIVRNSVR